ncbi:peptidylprolyl isomerase [Hymenobacter coccineus]|uniref:Peptidylprolyl isomerase n=1 Tax=Hymenobacter coccineus TaxID=1908235 RepID=A0A1G1T077_9BACT|nr:peptidylprolyl isomerase [Hymenobacter coccineus]OGX84268.1 peptidylprolyl isomerase [Hymenobacter coccineus]
MHIRFLHVGAAAVLFLAGCQATKPQATGLSQPTATGPAVETLGPVAVPASEFAYVYRKNNGTAADYGTRASVAEYLELYTNFRLKVLEAERRGLDTTQAFKRELDGYRQQLAQPYLTEKSVTDQLVQEAYDRMGQEVSAAHILIRVAPDAAPADTLAAYQKVMALRQQVAGGADFGALAKQQSEDPSAKENGGSLGYFTALQMVYPFETAAYKTPVGQVSPPIRTRFGYHLIKVNDRRAAQGEIKVAHLMVRVNAHAPAADSLTAKKKIDELYARLRKGEGWDKLVAQFSEDAGSAANGGELPPFGTGRMIPSFEATAFRLQKPGEIAPPVQTPYGWHIIKLLERQPVPAFATMETTLKNKVAKDSRSELNRAAFLKRIRQEDQFLEIPAVKAQVLARADSSLVAGRFKYAAPAAAADAKKKKPGAADNSVLFTIKQQPYYAKDFLQYVAQNQRPRPGAQPAFVMEQLYDQYVDQRLTDFEKNALDTKYEDYRMLAKEYRDGILLFQLMDEKVWSKAIEDSVGLKKFFAANQDKYQWGPRTQATVVSAATPALRKEAMAYFRIIPPPVTRQTSKGTVTTGVAEIELPTNRGIPATVRFQARTTTLLPASTTALDALAKRMADDTTLSVSVTEYTKTNAALALARQRTDAVKAYLVSKGAKPGKLLFTSAVLGGNESKLPASVDAVYLRGYTKDPAAIEQHFNTKNPLAVQIQQKAFQKGDSKAADQFLTSAPGSYTTQLDGRYYAVMVAKQLPAGPKALADARGQATSDYQNFLEKEWIAQLRQQYPVQVNQPEVDKLITK